MGDVSLLNASSFYMACQTSRPTEVYAVIVWYDYDNY